ncbi:MAG TPA: MFS transporter [Chloroflexi bacterium]|nr:MFS transporter [Chloroflexota bacterium]
MNEDTSTQGKSTETAAKRRWAAPFFTIWSGQALSLVGSRIGGFALVWWLTQASGGSATILAAASLVAMLPEVLLGPIVGALVDRWSRRRVMILADSLVALFSAALGVMAWAGTLRIWHIYLIMFIRALGGTFHWAAMQAATSLMVPKTQLARVSGMNQTLQGILKIATPPLGALAMNTLPLYVIMGIDVGTAIFAVAPLFFVQVPEPKQRARAPENPLVSLIADIKEGFAYIWHWTGVFIVMIVASLLNAVLNPAFSLMPILVTRHFNKGALELGWLESAWGAGMVAGGIILSAWGGFKRRILTSMMGLIGASVFFVLLGLAPSSAFWLAVIAMFGAGFMNPLMNGPFLAVLQDVVPPELQARTFTVIASLSGLATPLGMAIAGPLSDTWGVQVWFVIGGVFSLLMGIGLRVVPAVYHLEDGRVRTTEPTTEMPDMKGE